MRAIEPGQACALPLSYIALFDFFLKGSNHTYFQIHLDSPALCCYIHIGLTQRPPSGAYAPTVTLICLTLVAFLFSSM